MGDEKRGLSCENTTRHSQHGRRRKISQFGLLVFIILLYAHALCRILPWHHKLHPIGFGLFLYTLYLRYLVYCPEQLRKYDDLVERMMDKEQLARCGRCERWKFGRTRHCSRCTRCIPRLSHHCGLLSICIGAHNYKPFIHLILVGGISSLLQAYLLWPASLEMAVKVIQGEERLSLSMIAKLQANYVMFCLWVVFSVFASYHLLLTWFGWTVAEASKTLSLGDACPVWKMPRGVYDHGGVRNLEEAWGKGARMLWPAVDIERELGAGKWGQQAAMKMN